MSLFEKVRPGIKSHFFGKKMDANESEKKLHLMATKATNHSAKVNFLSEIQCIAQLALRLMQGMVLTASKRYSHSAVSLMYVSMRNK